MKHAAPAGGDFNARMNENPRRFLGVLSGWKRVLIHGNIKKIMNIVTTRRGHTRQRHGAAHTTREQETLLGQRQDDDDGGGGGGGNGNGNGNVIEYVLEIFMCSCSITASLETTLLNCGNYIHCYVRN